MPLSMHVKTDAASSVDREYRRHRRSVYAGIFAGYAAYYLVRNNLALAIPDILAAYPLHSKADLGWALTGSVAGPDDRAPDRQRLGAGHGLAALRQDHGPLVQHQGCVCRPRSAVAEAPAPESGTGTAGDR